MLMSMFRMYTGDDGDSHFEKISVELKGAANEGKGKAMSDLIDAHEIQFAESPAGGSFDWHNAPRRQYVITLSGQLEFESRKGEKHVVNPGDVMLFEDVTGGGHRWKLLNDQPWRRVYVHLEPAAK